MGLLRIIVRKTVENVSLPRCIPAYHFHVRALCSNGKRYRRDFLCIWQLYVSPDRVKMWLTSANPFLSKFFSKMTLSYPCWFVRRRHSMANCCRMVRDSAMVTVKSFHFSSDLDLWSLNLNFAPLITLVQCYVYTKLEVSTTFPFWENRCQVTEGRTDGQTDGLGATLNATHRENRLTIYVALSNGTIADPHDLPFPKMMSHMHRAGSTSRRVLPPGEHDKWYR